MALQIPSYPSPFGPDLADAYAWFESLVINFRSNSEAYTLAVHPDTASAYAGRPPIVTRQYVGGRNGFPTLAAMLASDPLLAQAFAYYRQQLYAAAVAADPTLAGATDTP